MNTAKLGKFGVLLTACAAGAALALLFASPFGAKDASAGGICRGNTGDFISSDSTGKQIYVWSFGSNPPSVYAYDFDAGTFTHKDLSLPALRKTEDGEKEVKPAKEINVSGTIWTPEPSERVAIINGKTYREGEIFTTASGKKYKLVEIRPTNDIVYEEVKE